MSGFLPGLVQRGASLPGSGSGPVLSAAPLVRAPAMPPGALEVSAEVTATPPASPVEGADPDGASTILEPIAREVPEARAAEHHVHVTKVNVSPPVIDEPRAPAPVPAPAVVTAEPAPVAVRLPPAVAAASPGPMAAARAALERQALDGHSASGNDAAPSAAAAQSRPRTGSPAILPRAMDRPANRNLPGTRIEPAPLESPALRRLGQQSAPTARAPQPPPIHVRIGKVEVRPPAPAVAPPPPKQNHAPPPLGFAAYRRLRTYR